MKIYLRYLLPLFIVALSVQDSFAQHKETEGGMKWYSMEEAHQLAKDEDKQILIFGMADWCPYCRKMIKEVYSDSAVQQTIAQYFYPVQLDTESDDIVMFNGTKVEERKLAAYLKLQSLPTHYFMDEEWVIYGMHPGFVPKEIFTPMLEYVGSGAHETMEFEQFLKSKESNSE